MPQKKNIAQEFTLSLREDIANGDCPWQHRFAADCVERVLPIILAKTPGQFEEAGAAVKAARESALDSSAVIRRLGYALSPAGAELASNYTAAGVAMQCRELTDSPDDELKWQQDRLQEYKEG